MSTRRKLGWASLGLAAIAGSSLGVALFAGRAEAIIGRPLTPMSYAGVARRTTRRAVAVGAVAHPYGYGYPYPPPPPPPAYPYAYW
jgi:hypothetical protein